eukprot:472696-Pyramimonas_sp.AAC.1
MEEYTADMEEYTADWEEEYTADMEEDTADMDEHMPPMWMAGLYFMCGPGLPLGPLGGARLGAPPLFLRLLAPRHLQRARAGGLAHCKLPHGDASRAPPRVVVVGVGLHVDQVGDRFEHGPGSGGRVRLVVERNVLRVESDALRQQSNLAVQQFHSGEPSLKKSSASAASRTWQSTPGLVTNNLISRHCDDALRTLSLRS